MRDLPEVTLTPSATELCVGQTTRIFYTGTASADADFEYDFGSDAIISVVDEDNFDLTWPTPGNRTIRLTVTDGPCVATVELPISVIDTLAAPAPECVRQDLDGVRFEWPEVAGADGYQVSINGEPFGAPQLVSFLEIGDLDFGETVTIRVMAVRDGTPCNESIASEPIACAARECPTVTFNPGAARTDFCAGEDQPVTLLANLTGDDGSGTISWSGPGVSQDNDGSFRFDPVAAGVGVHVLSVTYVQETLCSYESDLTMTVTAVPAATFGSSADQICAGTNVTVGLTTSVASDVTYTWDFAGAAVTELGGQQYDLRWSAAGTYVISLTTNRNGCSDTQSTEVTVQEPVTAGDATLNDLMICFGDDTPVDLAAQLTGADAGGTWSVVSGGGVANGSLDPVTGLLNPATLGTGNYVFGYTVAGGSCPDATATVGLTVLAAPQVDAGPSQTLTCTMGMVSLDGSGSESGPGYTYEWTAADPNIIITGADQLMVDVGQPGTYQLRVTNPTGCTAVSEVVVDAETEAPVMELQVSQITCFSADNGAISVSRITGGRAPYTFAVNGEDQGGSRLFGNLEAGEYDIQIRDANGCFSNVILDISQPEELTVRLEFPGDSTEVSAGDRITVTATIGGGNPIDTLIWQPDSLATEDGQSGISFIAEETRMISVTVVDELGCTATDNQMLLVRRDRPVFFPTAFSPNGDATNDRYFIGADLSQVSHVSDFFIFDRWGEAVYTGPQNVVTDLATGGPAVGFLPNDPNLGWDGTHDGQLMNPQVLVYTATVHFVDGETITYKGDFVLMR